MSSSEPVDAADASSPPLVMAQPQTTAARVPWDELRRVAEQVQEDLDDADEILEHAEFASVLEMWQHELQDTVETGVDETEVEAATTTTTEAVAVAPVWYSSANAYWEDEANCPLDDNGVLGGFAHISPLDVRDSNEFIYKLALRRPQWKRETAVDCGAGIGRVSQQLLLPLFRHVDLVEQSERLLRGAPQYLRQAAASGAKPTSRSRGRVRTLYCMGLQDFEPETAGTSGGGGGYDLIWVQWVSSHLTDVDFVRFLRRCQRALAPHGWIGIKENVLLSGAPFELDRGDSSMTRCDVYFRSLFEQAGLEVLAEQTQTDFPDELYPVMMFALA